MLDNIIYFIKHNYCLIERKFQVKNGIKNSLRNSGPEYQTQAMSHGDDPEQVVNLPYGLDKNSIAPSTFEVTYLSEHIILEIARAAPLTNKDRN